ncbi:MAG: hypothetical protein WC526_01855 [Patescibacteria group bacterium]
MNKKTLIVVVVVVGALVVLGGIFYGYNRWRQQRIANQILSLYGGNTGLLGKLTGGDANQIAQEMARQQAIEEANTAAQEAAKTPEDKYNATQEMQAYDDNSRTVSGAAKAIVEQVFGKAKLTSYTTGYFASTPGSGAAIFETIRPATAADVGAFNKILTDKGLQIISSGTDNQDASIMAGNDNEQYIIGFGIGSQEITVTIVKTAQ